MTLSIPRRLAATTAIVALATMALAGSANAADMTITGQSTSTIELTLASASGSFGSGLTPDGATPTGGDVVAAANIDQTLGACYELPSHVTVSSNVPYDVNVQSSVTNTSLRFITSDPTTYAGCTGGVIINTPMVLAFGATRTASREHAFTLGLTVLWSAAPSATLGNAVLTFSLTAS